MKSIPEDCQGDQTYILYASGYSLRGSMQSMKTLKESPFVGDKTVLLRIEGITKKTLNALILFLRARKIRGEEVSEEIVIENMHPPEGQIYHVMQMATAEELFRVANGWVGVHDDVPVPRFELD